MDEIFDESHYFVCSGGLKPASMKSNQNIVKTEDGKYYLTEYSLKCYAIDFSCKWVALLYAIVAAALALLLSCPAGWVLLAAIIGAGVGAALGAAMCGDMAAIMRVWVAIKTDAQLGEHNAVANKPSVHMICNAFSGQITYVPNVKSEFHALVLFAGNTLMTGLEGFMYVYAFRGAGMLITKPMQFFANFGVNYLKTVSVAGFAGRTVFGAWGGFSAYSNSSTEGFHSEEVFTEAGKSFGFAEVAAYHAVTERDPQSIALLLSLGGIPGGRSGKDANGLADVKAAGNAVAEGWKNTGEKVANQISNKINAAKEFRERLKSQKKGNGAHENPQPTIEELVQKANEAYDRAKALYEALGEKYTKKTVASDEIKAVSGWGEKPEGYTNTSPESVKTHADNIGHEPTRAGAMDQKHSGGFDGKYNCSHSEKQIWTEKPNEPIGSSREVCPDCQGFGSKQAISTGKPNVVAGPEGTHIYYPDGSYEFIPRD